MLNLESLNLEQMTSQELTQIEGGSIFKDIGRVIGAAAAEFMNWVDDQREINQRWGLVGLK